MKRKDRVDSLQCPKCGHAHSRVTDSRPQYLDNAIQRRRRCASCRFTFRTFEVIATDIPMQGVPVAKSVQRLIDELRGVLENFGRRSGINLAARDGGDQSAMVP